MNQREYAKHCGVSAQAVSLWVKSGHVLLNAEGRIDVAKTDKALDTWRRAKHQPVIVDGVTFMQARTMREDFKARLTRIEYERVAGQLIEKSEVQRQAFKCARRTRDALLAVGARIASLVRAAESDFEAQQIVEEEILKALENLVGVLDTNG